ncbi:MAG: chemotaxis response regulator protein-glutamate methylesterase [Spirochaetes bacterium]|nr:chemotaxis response regulator protein-glutamate methylesterase [Spirochaetota bacterium]
MKEKTVLIIDDSALMRKMLSIALDNTPGIKVVATAMDPYIAANKINRFKPDIITLDIQMPRMDGLTFLSKLMVANPVPVIMVSAFTDKGANETMKALQMGAVDFILKPNYEDSSKWENFIEELIEKIKSIDSDKIQKKLINKPVLPANPMVVEKKYSADVIIPKKKILKYNIKTDKIIVIGASTGGTEVIDRVLSELPEEIPGIVIAQHMPEKFTEAFANRVNTHSRLYVKEAEDSERIYSGMAVVAPGGRHMILKHDKDGYFVVLNDGPPVNRHRPSVDVLFRSAAQCAGKNAIGVILTGMGNDGAEGLLEMRDEGAVTAAQDEESCVVFGMPNEAIKRNAACEVLNIEEIIEFIKDYSYTRV